jgi:hypothetical protein
MSLSQGMNSYRYKQLVSILDKEPSAWTSFSPVDMVRTAHRVRLANVVYRIFRSQGHLDLLWQEVFKPVVDESRDQAIRRMFISIKINDLFQKAGIPIIHLKGLPLSQKLFGCPLVRDSCDIDLYVSPQYLAQADSLLLENGIIRQKYSNISDIESIRDRRLAKDIPYLSEKYNVKIELHWRLFRWKNKFNKPFEYYWQNKEIIFINNHKFYTLSPLDEYVYIGVHGANHGFECLHWLYDFVCYSNLLNPDHIEKIEEKVKDLHIQREYRMATYCAERIFPKLFALNHTPCLTQRDFMKQVLIFFLYHSERKYRFKRKVLHMLSNYFAFI